MPRTQYHVRSHAVLVWLAATALQAQVTIGASSRTQPFEVEPPLELIIEAGDQQVIATAGEPFVVKWRGEQIPMRIVPRDYRVLNTGKVRFRYPAAHSFEFNRDGTSRLWTLDGNSNVIILEQTPRRPAFLMLKAREWEIAAQFGELVRTRENVSLRLGGRELRGRRVVTQIAGEVIQQDVYALSTRTATFILVIQDSLTDEEEMTAETQSVLSMLQESFEVIDAEPAPASRPASE